MRVKMAKPTRVVPGASELEDSGRRAHVHSREGSKHKDGAVTSTETAHAGAQGGRNAAGELTDAVGSQLRTAYSELLKEPVPDKFAELLSRLAHKEKDAEDPHS